MCRGEDEGDEMLLLPDVHVSDLTRFCGFKMNEGDNSLWAREGKQRRPCLQNKRCKLHF